MDEDILFKKQGPIAYVTVNREKALNALNGRIIARLDRIFSELEQEAEIIVVIITGTGHKAFVAGADIREIKESGGKRSELIGKGQEVFSRIRNSSKVVIAAVNGYALGGGCELALACDIRIASENAKFGFPEATLGLMPGYGGTQLLPRLIGPGRAKYMIFTGGMLTAAEAYQFGLVGKVCSSGDLMEEVSALARKISSCGPFALQACKRAIDGGVQIPLDDALKLELQEYGKVARSEDAEEGIAAFLGKRPPAFRGR